MSALSEDEIVAISASLKKAPKSQVTAYLKLKKEVLKWLI